jgi:cAMP-dependent protein kinase regulator
MNMSTFDVLIADLTRDVNRAQPKDPLQFSANWFHARLEEQRAQARDILAHRSPSLPRELPMDVLSEMPLSETSTPPRARTPYALPLAAPNRPPMRASIAVPNSPFGTLNIPGNALLSEDGQNYLASHAFQVESHDIPPTSPLTTATANQASHATPFPPNSSPNPGDFLHPPTSTIFARRSSISAESIVVDGSVEEHIPHYPKTPDQLRRIKASIAKNFIFRDLDEEQETGVLNAMQERKVVKDDVVIRQGDVGEYFYVVESGLLYCFIRPEPLPPTWLTEGSSQSNPTPPESFLQPGYHPEFGKKVAECKPGNSFGELALMYGHPRAATVLAIEPSTLWSLDRITFRTIILKAAHRRRTMYEQFLASVTLLSSLEPEERSKIADALVSRVYLDGEPVVRQGEMGDTFFFVEEGEAIVTKTQVTDQGLKEIKVGHLKKGDYFGGKLRQHFILSDDAYIRRLELSLLRLEPRAATVSGITRTDPSAAKLKVAALDAPAFTRLLGPLREIMERKAGERYNMPPS